jgi:hypothetical protein
VRSGSAGTARSGGDTAGLVMAARSGRGRLGGGGGRETTEGTEYHGVFVTNRVSPPCHSVNTVFFLGAGGLSPGGGTAERVLTVRSVGGRVRWGQEK